MGIGLEIFGERPGIDVVQFIIGRRLDVERLADIAFARHDARLGVNAGRRGGGSGGTATGATATGATTAGATGAGAGTGRGRGE